MAGCLVLSKEYLENIENDCPVAALGSEMPRQAPEVRHAATSQLTQSRRRHD